MKGKCICQFSSRVECVGCYSGQLVSALNMSCLTDLKRAHAHGHQNQAAALFGTISKLKAKFYLLGEFTDRFQSGDPKKVNPQESFLSLLVCRKLSLLRICRQGLQDNMANGSLPRQSGTNSLQEISYCKSQIS